MQLNPSKFEDVIRHYQYQSPAGAATAESDCRALAIAFACTLASGLDPALSSYNQISLRENIKEAFKTHLCKSTEVGNIVRGKRSQITVKLYCKCKLSYIKEIDDVEGMIECDVRQVYYHRRCDGVPDNASLSKEYICCSCQSTGQSWHCSLPNKEKAMN